MMAEGADTGNVVRGAKLFGNTGSYILYRSDRGIHTEVLGVVRWQRQPSLG
jgi:hypothetical protein